MPSDGDALLTVGANGRVRILHVIPWLAPRYGGPAILVPQTSVALAERGHESEIVTTDIDGHGSLDVETCQRVTWAGATTTFHPVSFPRSYVTSWSLWKDVRRRVRTFDVVHIHQLYRFHLLATAFEARSAGVPYILQVHGALDPWTRTRKRRAKDLYHVLVEDRIINGATALLSTSRRERESIAQLGYVGPIFVVPPGVDGSALQALADSDSFNQAVGLSETDMVVTFLGRLSRLKGLDILVRAFGRVSQTMPNARLVVAGPDDEGLGTGLRTIAAAGGYLDRVIFAGPVQGKRKASLLQRSNVVVLPSLGESFGIAAAEAMAVGCPVIVTPGVAVEEIVRARGAGLVVARDPASLSEAIISIFADPTSAESMGRAGRSAVEELLGWSTVAERLESVYLSATQYRAPASGQTA